MELIPVAAIAGAFIQNQLVSTGPANISLQPRPQAGLTRQTLNHIWSQVVAEYPYQSLQFDPSSDGGAFIGESAEDATIFAPPLVQVRHLIGVDGVEAAAKKIEFVFRTAAHHIGNAPVNLGVKLVYHAPAPAGTSVDFIRSELIKADDEVQTMAGAMVYEASLKYLFRSPEAQYTLSIEPLHADPTQVFIDLDAQFPGNVDISRIGERVSQVQAFMTTEVRTFLTKRAEGWGR